MADVPIQNDFGESLRRARKEKKLSQADLAALMETSRNTVVNWENGRCKPEWEVLRALARALNLTGAELLCLPAREEPDKGERLLLARYRELSETGRRTVCRMARVIAQEETRARRREAEATFRVLPLMSTPAAAGVGCPFDDGESQDRYVRRGPITDSADALIRVSGPSMEPKYRDGDLVAVRWTDSARPGEDVICSTADGAVIKRMGRSRLLSLNGEYPFGAHYEDDAVRVLGVVTGILDAQRDLPDADRERELAELFQEDGSQGRTAMD